MSKLLKSDLFDNFELREAVLHLAFKAFVDGNRNTDFFDTTLDEPLSPYLTWSEVRPAIYQLMSGDKLPSYFKIVLSTPQSKTATLSPDLEACFLNITFKDNQITCTTGVAYKHFTLDKSADLSWDTTIKDFLFKHTFL